LHGRETWCLALTEEPKKSSQLENTPCLIARIGFLIVLLLYRVAHSVRISYFRLQMSLIKSVIKEIDYLETIASF
jgi:hypothetical protein